MISSLKIAKLAKLPINDKQAKKLEEQFAKTLDFINQLKEVDVKNVAPTAQVTGLVNVLREDVVDASRTFSQDQALSNAAKTYNGFFYVDNGS